MILDLGILELEILDLRSQIHKSKILFFQSEGLRSKIYKYKILFLRSKSLRSKISNLLGESEARYMLITCSAFINYLTAKHETKQ